ncbi:AbfB domain-containing protein [Actinoplanes siamensis]|uniref:AbfB domain-containing protein n=1 Tax=Actinoplanes siamensis TaxID=1223317 RepID=UPI001944595B|nr:AbfB domain-containing protein [Actinoplanes siamensis]
MAAVTASALGGNQETGSPAFVAGEVPPAPPPARTVAIAPIPSSEPPLFGSAPTEPVATHRRTSNPPARRIIPMTPVTTPVGVTLRVGETVALTLADRPGLRIRHRYFIARVDAIPAHGGALDRADSSFTVRTGLHNSGCVSLESVNYPGYFLRHQNFALKLHRRDGSGLYDQDATFCPVAIRSGAALVLRSTNYPARFVTESNSRLRLRESAADDALALVPRTVG